MKGKCRKKVMMDISQRTLPVNIIVSHGTALTRTQTAYVEKLKQKFRT